MSVHLGVFLLREQLPTRDSWQRAIDAEGIDLQLEQADTIEQVGFWPARLNKKDCGFEYSFGRIETSIPVESENPDPILEAVGDRDHQVSFVFHSSREDGEAAALAAATLAKIADGVLFDPQSGEFAVGADAYELLRRQEADERERRMQDAIKRWGGITNRRCPECGAPCPEFRPTCKVCDFKLGRA